MGRTRYKIYDKDAAHFLTATVVNWIPLFSNPDHAQTILDALRYLVEQERWTLYAYVVMENHVHIRFGKKEVSPKRFREKPCCVRKSNTSIKILSAVAMWMNRRTGDIRARGTTQASRVWCR